MATLMSAVIVMARDRLNEPVPRFWSNAELLRYANRGIRDMHRQLGANHQDYFHAINVEVVHPANGTQLTGVPTNVTVINGIEPADLTAAGRHVVYVRRDYNGDDFQAARSRSAVDPSNAGVILYAPTQAGGPVAAPVIHVAPMISAAITLRLTYRPTVGAELVATDPNPIPGESDNALQHWIVAYAKGRQTDKQRPDASELEMYQAEVSKILASITPRDVSAPEVVEAMFEEMW
jgi:hypothetical protein